MQSGFVQETYLLRWGVSSTHKDCLGLSVLGLRLDVVRMSESESIAFCGGPPRESLWTDKWGHEWCHFQMISLGRYSCPNWGDCLVCKWAFGRSGKLRKITPPKRDPKYKQIQKIPPKQNQYKNTPKINTTYYVTNTKNTKQKQKYRKYMRQKLVLWVAVRGPPGWRDKIVLSAQPAGRAARSFARALCAIS